MQALRKILSGAVGGFAGGSLIGLLEAAVIAWTGGGDEYGAFRFGALSYGILGTGLGAGIGLAAAVLPLLARDARATAAL